MMLVAARWLSEARWTAAAHETQLPRPGVGVPVLDELATISETLPGQGSATLV
jgi:hypothetical protein